MSKRYLFYVGPLGRAIDFRSGSGSCLGTRLDHEPNNAYF